MNLPEENFDPIESPNDLPPVFAEAETTGPDCENDELDKISPETTGRNPFKAGLSPELKRILAEQGRETTEVELDVADYSQIRFQMANGHAVRVAVTPFEPYFDYGVKRAQFYSVKIFSSDGMPMGEIVQHYEFRIEHEYALAVIPALWQWLHNLQSRPRDFDDYDTVDDFIEDIAEQIDGVTIDTEKSASHAREEPIYTDQNEPDSRET